MIPLGPVVVGDITERRNRCTLREQILFLDQSPLIRRLGQHPGKSSCGEK